MANWIIEMAYGTNIAMEVEACSKDEAIHKAKQAVERQVTISDNGEGYVDIGGLGFESITYIGTQNN